MVEMKTIKEWKPEPGDVFRFHINCNEKAVGKEVVFQRMADEGWMGGDPGVGYQCGDEETGLWSLVRRANKEKQNEN